MSAPTHLITPSPTRRLEIRCNVGDAVVANLAVHVVFFFQRRLETALLSDAFARALTQFPVFAGRMVLRKGRMHLHCDGQGVPLSFASSDRTLLEAIRSVSEDSGLWLADPVNGATARWGLGPLCRVRVTHLADDTTAIGFSWHHAIGDMQTFMLFMRAWCAAAADEPLPQPLIVKDRAAYLDAHLPADRARELGVRCLGLAELARSALYLAKTARKQRTLSLYFGDDEITRMRNAYGNGIRLSSNDVVCAHVSEALMRVDPTVDRRTLAIAVNARNHCGLDPMLVGNIITTLNIDLHRGDSADSIAERIRSGVNHFVDEHCDIRVNQQFLDGVGAWRAARCVSTAFNPARWNPVVTNWSSFGVYGLRFENTNPAYCTLLMNAPVAGLGAIVEGAEGRGMMFRMALPPKEFSILSSPETRQELHRFRHAADDIPRLHRALAD